ncbi:MAG: hypothetical protein ABIP55_16820 [Tepidisphaeraceae bacterium]
MVTWTVVCSILFVTSTILAIYFYVAKSQAEKDLTGQTTKYQAIVPASAITSPDVTELDNLKKSENAFKIEPQMSIFNAAIKQRNMLSEMIGGSGANPVAAYTSAKETLEQTAEKLKPAGLTLPTSDNLVGAVQALGSGLQARIDANNDLQGQLAASKKAQADNIAASAATIKQMEDAVEQLRAEHTEAMNQLTAYREQKNTDVAGIEAAAAEARDTANRVAQGNQVALREKDREIEQLTRDLKSSRDILGELRPDPGSTVVRQVDARINRVPEQGTVFIDLGQRNSVVPGLTFEVFDKSEGVPPAGDPQSDEKLPSGKASLEVVRVGPDTSEARVTRQTPGSVITEGDLCVNLVYDQNTKYNFLVYGNFDLDQNKQGTPQDTEVIKRLITQWGANLTDKVNIDTDFVVLGKEPELPVFTREDLIEPLNAKRLSDAQAELDSYETVRQKAVEMRIPILNQNRFLYLVGFYNQATR